MTCERFHLFDFFLMCWSRSSTVFSPPWRWSLLPLTIPIPDSPSTVWLLSKWKATQSTQFFLSFLSLTDTQRKRASDFVVFLLFLPHFFFSRVSSHLVVQSKYYKWPTNNSSINFSRWPSSSLIAATFKTYSFFLDGIKLVYILRLKSKSKRLSWFDSLFCFVRGLTGPMNAA